MRALRLSGPWSSDWRNWCRTDDQADPRDAPRRRGLVTLCIGGGQGIALAIEALH